LSKQGVSGRSEATTSTVATTDDDTPRHRGGAVRFGSVRLHTHKRVLGDNPAVHDGPPITLDWAVQKSERFQSVDDYDKVIRAEDNDPTKEHHPHVKRIAGFDRTQMMREAGHSYGSMARVYEEINKIKKDRTKPTDPVIEEDEEEEHTKPKVRGLGRWFGGGDKKKHAKPAGKSGFSTPASYSSNRFGGVKCPELPVKNAPTKRNIGISNTADEAEA